MPIISTTRAEEAAALLAGGARLVRHKHDMVLDIASPRSGVGRPGLALPEGLQIQSGDWRVTGLARARLAAHPPGHPDAGVDDTLEAAEGDVARRLAGAGSAGSVIPKFSLVI